MTTLFGLKPCECPAAFALCGACNIYPCLIGQPSVAAVKPPKTSLETIKDIAQSIEAMYQQAGVRYDDPI
jgi:hypothetical protein